MKTNHTMCISKTLIDLYFTKRKIKTKNTFVKVVYTVLVLKMYILTEHKEVCLSIHSAQPVGLEKGTIEFKNCFKQIPVPFKTYAGFECNLKSIESYEGSYSKNIKITFLVVLITNLFVLLMNLLSQ